MTCKDMSLKALADWASRLADDAQVRVLEERSLWDDRQWQPIMDAIRTELLRLAQSK